MRRIMSIIFSALFPLCVFSQKVIQMESQNGVYRISCSVNGAKMKMIFDTGASKVSLSESMANFLYDNGYISKEDVLGTSKTQTADGSIHDNVVINIKDIEISGLHLKNVQAVVISSQNAPLLLGQSAIQKLGHISLDGNRLIINDYSDNLSEKEIDVILDAAKRHYDNKSYQMVIDELVKVMANGGLSIAGYAILLESCYNTKQYTECISYGKDCLRKNKNAKPSGELSVVLGMMADSHQCLKQYQNALVVYQKLLLVDQALGQNYSINVCFDYHQIAACYYFKEDWRNCIANSKLALKEYFKVRKTSETEIKNKGINDDDIGSCLYFYAYALYYDNEKSKGDYVMMLSARCNYDNAIEFCVKNNINYKSQQSVFE